MMSIIPFPELRGARITPLFPAAFNNESGYRLIGRSNPFDRSPLRWRAGESRLYRRDHLVTQGAIIPIGGAEAHDPSSPILRAFIDHAGGTQARIMILPTASREPDTGRDYAGVFRRLGATSVDIADISSREEANSPELSARLESVTGLFVTGGDQSRLSSLVVGTCFAETIRLANQRGLVVAGTSAGASILSTHMLSNGVSESPPHKGMVETVSGFGLLNDIIIDQHFNARGRIGRLLVSFAANPGLIAFGVDENTAVVITPDRMAKVIGENSVIVVDGRSVYSDVNDRADGDILTITGANIHVLAPGRIFDLEQRRLLHLRQEQTGRPAG